MKLMYCNNRDCDYNATNVEELEPGLWACSGFLVAATMPCCVFCGVNLSDAPYDSLNEVSRNILDYINSL